MREEIRARPATFAAIVFDVRDNFLTRFGPWPRVGGGPFEVAVYGDIFEVSSLFLPVKFMRGCRWCYRAGDTTMRVVPGWRHDWIEIVSQPPAGRAIRIRFGRSKTNREIWYALLRAGLQPLGDPPE